MNKILKLSIFIFSLSTYSNAYSQSYFDSVWTKIEKQSYALIAASESEKASDEELKKANRHWLPQVYLGGASYMTDDAGANMFALLSQRSITNSDFMAASLNDPGMNHYTKLSLGVELALYEGNAGINYKKISERMFKAEKYNAMAIKDTLRAEYVKMFWGLQIYDKYEETFTNNLSSLSKLEKSYQLGSKENLLGYSGKLGLKNLNLKIQSLIDSIQAKKVANLKALEELSQDAINNDSVRSTNMNEVYLSLLTNAGEGVKNSTESFREKAQAKKESIELQKARLRPQVALFADQTFFKGDREIDEAKTVGISFKWNLFSKENLNLDTKTVYESSAAYNSFLAYQQNDKIEYSSLVDFEKILVESYTKTQESKKLLTEQVDVTTRLFKNGMINILQLLEVLNQEINLNESIVEIEEKLLQVRMKKLIYVKK